jgi:CRP-like cAMP-binding protein
MVTVDEIRDINAFQGLTEEMLAKLAPLVEKIVFDEGDLIFNAGDPAENFYMLKRGKVLLEQPIAPQTTISLGSVKPGYSFGWSGMLPEGRVYTLNTICAERCEVFMIRKTDILELIAQDHSMGFLLIQNILQIVKRRLDRRTEQFLRVIMDHPDMRPLFHSEESDV